VFDPDTASADSCAERLPPADPRDIHLSYTHRHNLHSGHDAARAWHIRADVRYGAMCLADEDPAGHVGDIQIVTVAPNADNGPLAGLETTSANQDRICQVLFDSATGRLSRIITDHIGRRRSRRRILILHDARLTPQWRGFGLGTLLIGTAIKTVSADCRVAACYPSPAADQDTRHSSYDPVDVQIAYATLGEVFEQLGFEHVSAGVFILNLTSSELDRSLTQLRARIDEPGPALR
jgi:hypothetical protein